MTGPGPTGPTNEGGASGTRESEESIEAEPRAGGGGGDGGGEGGGELSVDKLRWSSYAAPVEAAPWTTTSCSSIACGVRFATEARRVLVAIPLDKPRGCLLRAEAAKIR